jgi:hypothetical protein
MGIVGASDIHNGLSASNEDAYASGMSGLDPNTMLPTGDRAKAALGMRAVPQESDDLGGKAFKLGHNDRLELSNAAITGVWAEENARNSIFAALKRKETFATSGTRIRARMFGGWSFTPEMLKRTDWAATAYAGGVPMGGDLPSRPAGSAAPRFLVQAVKDPDGANLDRVQIIKIWLDHGTYQEKVFDVALSGNRKVEPKTRRAPVVGNTVDLTTGEYRNTIGSPQLTTVWHDTEFDPSKPAVYYARVLEIPTARWSTLLAIKSKLPIPEPVPATIQQRAWTSPIWFTPAEPAIAAPG